MDPISAIGLVASVLQVASTCVKTVHTLEQLKHRFNAAPSSIEALYTESTIVSASLSHLVELFNRSDNTLVNVLRAKPELSSALDRALSGCNAVYVSLDQDLQKICASSDNNDKLGIRRRTSFLWRQDIFKGYLAQIHGHQSALTLLIQGLQMHSLSDINLLLRETKSILADMSLSHDQVTLRGTPSIALSEASDVDPSLEEKVTDFKAHRRVMETPISQSQSPVLEESVPEDNLIDLSERPSLLDSAIEEQLSPALEDLKGLGNVYHLEAHAPEAYIETSVSSSMTEKRDSAQSHEVSSTPTTLREEIGGSSRRTSELLTPIYPGNSGGSHFQRNPSTSTIYSNTSQSSVQSEFPGVVGIDVPQDPFPVLEHRPPHVPPTTKEELATLQARRRNVMKGGNVNERLTWAEEALHFTSLASMHRDRMSKLQSNPIEVPAIEKMLETDAKHVIETEAQNGVANALFLKSMYFGLNTAQSTELYISALSKGHCRSAFYIGMMYENNKEMKQAISYYNQGADGRDSASHYRLAQAFLGGDLNQKKDHKRAINHLKIAAAAADADFPQALFLLATLQAESYRKSFKIKESLLPIDNIMARQNFEKAAFLGEVNSQLRMGRAYSSAKLGCPKNTKLALHYFRLAARQGEPNADLDISTIFWWGEKNILEPNHRIAFVHARRAAETRLVASFCQVGYFYENAIGVQKNELKAREWYLKGAAAGDETAQKRLDSMRKRGVFGVA